jgi:hypothetical protein
MKGEDKMKTDIEFLVLNAEPYMSQLTCPATNLNQSSELKNVFDEGGNIWVCLIF